jgi:archaellum component FlaG (FlaF/FlaG flagellin family)
MKHVLRIFALSVVVAGGAAAALAPKTTHVVPSHQSATASLPTPACGPRMCTPDGN